MIVRCMLAFGLSAIVFAPHAMAQSRPAQCLLEVKGVHYIGGPCSFTPLDPRGSFRITDVQGLNLVAQVNVSNKDEGKASWNGPLGGKDSAKPIGDASRSGGCWTLSDSDSDDYNDSRICAWGLNDRIYLGPSPGKPDPASTIYYGSRVGMYDDIVSRRGLDTRNAEIKAGPSKEGAVKFCREYSRDYSQKCVEAQLRESPTGTITGNCQDKTFSNLYGYKFKFLGKASDLPGKKPEDMSADYAIRELEGGEILDGSTASGYDIALGAYQALCPSSAPKTPD
jgi:hypothetical protein